ncbi:hypothetical protein GCM10028895_00990 [Pontibacter rugosus]
MAFIEPEDIYSKIILEDLMDRAREMFLFEMQFFKEVKNAYTWFRDSSATTL